MFSYDLEPKANQEEVYFYYRFTKDGELFKRNKKSAVKKVPVPKKFVTGDIEYQLFHKNILPMVIMMKALGFKVDDKKAIFQMLKDETLRTKITEYEQEITPINQEEYEEELRKEKNRPKVNVRYE